MPLFKYRDHQHKTLRTGTQKINGFIYGTEVGGLLMECLTGKINWNVNGSLAKPE
jgi:hypothetical protein